MESSPDIRYPIGTAKDQPYYSEPFTDSLKNKLILNIQILPASLERAIENLDEKTLAMPYRPGGWTVNQLVHHVADSHMMAFMRCKWALTEREPVISAYDQDAWAHLGDVSGVPVNFSLTLLHALHVRWVALLQSITEEQWSRTVFHPEKKTHISLWEILRTYSWHGKHHVAQITAFRSNLHNNNKS